MVKNTFNIRLPKITQAILKNLQVSMGEAGVQVMGAVQQDSPQIPKVTGTLSSSGSVIVNGRLVAVSRYVGGAPEIVQNHDNRADVKDQIVATIIFGMPYAAEVHAESQKGANFLSTKLSPPRPIIQTIAKGVKE